MSLRHRTALLAIGVSLGAVACSTGGDDAVDTVAAADTEPATTSSPSTLEADGSAERADSGGVVADPGAQAESSTIDTTPPEMGIDHWHDAYLVHHCGTDLPPSTITEGPNGIHTHGEGLVHIHPFTTRGAGDNATFGVFIEAIGGQLNDDTYTPGAGEDPTVLSEAEGCDGEAATLQLAYWANAWTDEEPQIITENIGEVKFDDPSGGAFTLALLPAGAEIPKPPVNRLELLEAVNGSRD